MKARIVRIGNSRGLRIPKALLDQTGLTGEVDLDVEDGRLVIRPSQAPRQGWDAAFRAMAEQEDDRLLDSERWPSTRWDEKEWEWR